MSRVKAVSILPVQRMQGPPGRVRPLQRERPPALARLVGSTKRKRRTEMGKYEPKDSRIVTQNPSATPIEPERTGPREGGTRTDDTPRRDTKRMTGKETGKKDDDDRWQVNRDNRRFDEEEADRDNQE